MSIIKDGKYISNEGQVLGHKDTHITIRGFPRRKDWIEEVEKTMGGKLVSDKEIALITRLDRGLAQAKHKLEKFPEFIMLPDDMSTLYIPIPFEIYFLNLTMNSYHKPAWLKVKKHFAMGVPSWKK